MSRCSDMFNDAFNERIGWFIEVDGRLCGDEVVLRPRCRWDRGRDQGQAQDEAGQAGR
jgi:hypothetical protein